GRTRPPKNIRPAPDTGGCGPMNGPDRHGPGPLVMAVPLIAVTMMLAIVVVPAVVPIMTRRVMPVLRRHRQHLPGNATHLDHTIRPVVAVAPIPVASRVH